MKSHAYNRYQSYMYVICVILFLHLLIIIILLSVCCQLMFVFSVLEALGGSNLFQSLF